MKKSLIALAVAGAFAAPAFAATENVDVYGKLHMSVSLFDDQQETLIDPVTGAILEHGSNDLQISSNASRIGFKGAEDLGGGLSAIWQIESGVLLDEQTGTLADRNSFVGLKGGFGTVLLGNHDAPLKLVGRAVDLFGDTMADSRNVMGKEGADIRAKNVVAYISPDFAGFGFAAAYSTDPKADGSERDLSVAVNAQGTSFVSASADREDNGVYSLSATYNNGPIFVGLGYGDGDYHENNGIGAHLRVAGGLTFGNFKVVGEYDSVEDDSTTVGALPGDYDAFMLGGAFTMGNIVLKANYMEGEYDVTGASADPEQFTIGADYNMSKRTTVYALYADGTNITIGKGAGSSDQLRGAAVAGSVDRDISVLSVGVTHSF